MRDSDRTQKLSDFNGGDAKTAIVTMEPFQVSFCESVYVRSCQNTLISIKEWVGDTHTVSITAASTTVSQRRLPGRAVRNQSFYSSLIPKQIWNI